MAEMHDMEFPALKIEGISFENFRQDCTDMRDQNPGPNVDTL